MSLTSRAHQFSPVLTAEDGVPELLDSAHPRFVDTVDPSPQPDSSQSRSEPHSRTRPLYSPSNESTRGATYDKEVMLDEIELQPTMLPTVLPTTLEEAIRQLRESQSEVARLQSRLNHDIVSKPLSLNGGGESDANRDLSESHTRNQREQAYEEWNSNSEMTSDEAPHAASCCECLCGPSGAPRQTMTLEQYFVTPIYMLLLKRLPWLVVLLVVQSFSASILRDYDGMLEAHLVISFFVPMVVGTGGNAGNQCSVMVTRALALGMGDAEVLRVVRKETPIALLTAALLGVTAYGRVILEYPHDPRSALAIAITLGASILISIILGIFFSYAIEKWSRCDPADGAAPMLSTISDLIGIALLCSIAVAVL